MASLYDKVQLSATFSVAVEFTEAKPRNEPLTWLFFSNINNNNNALENHKRHHSQTLINAAPYVARIFTVQTDNEINMSQLAVLYLILHRNIQFHRKELIVAVKTLNLTRSSHRQLLNLKQLHKLKKVIFLLVDCRVINMQ